MKERHIQKLIQESAGICNFPNCREVLFYEYEDKSFIKLVEFCHIIGEKSKGPRGHPTKSQLMKSNPKNIILLCVKHHIIVDGNEKEYTIDKLYQMKENHIKFVKDRLTGLKEANWTLIIHSGNVTGKGELHIDKELIIREFYCTHIFSDTQELDIPEYLVETKNWDYYTKIQEDWWKRFQTFKDSPNKFVICSINFIPIVIHLGYLIHDTHPTEIYQYNRYENTWKWKKYDENKKNEFFYHIENNDIQGASVQKIALSVSISASIHDDSIFEVLGGNIKILKINVINPDRKWLKYKEQLIEFQKIFINILDFLISNCKNLKEIHLFYAGPTPIAYIIGSSINPNMHPKFILYNYFKDSVPKYTRIMELN